MKEKVIFVSANGYYRRIAYLMYSENQVKIAEEQRNLSTGLWEEKNYKTIDYDEVDAICYLFDWR